MQETGYETFSFYYDALTENVNYPAGRHIWTDWCRSTNSLPAKSCWIWHAAPAP
ncbi:MAG: hypothetical protein ACLTXT_07705 [Ruminococcus callidus]